MTAQALIETTVLLGLFVLAGGGYGGLYSIGRIAARPSLVRAGRMCWVVALAIALVITFATPLEIGWKLLVLASAIVYAVIPPVTWRYLERTHAEQGLGQ